MTVEPVGLVLAMSLSCLVWVIATRWLAMIVLSLAEPSEPAEEVTASRARSPLFEVGRLPSREQLLAAAMLTGGRARVAELLLAQAVADGWLVERPSARGRFDVFDPRDDASPGAAGLKRRLGHAPDAEKARAAASEAAAERLPALTAELERGGLRRPLAHHALAIAAGLFSGAAFTFAFVEFREMAAGDPSAQRLVLAMAGLFALGMIAALATLPRRSAKADAYVAWLLDATRAAQEAAQEGTSTSVRDVSLAVVTGGLGALGGARYRSLRAPEV